MKNLFLLVLLTLMTTYESQAQFRQLSSGTGNSYSTSNFNVCGNPGTRNFRVSYSHCPTIFGVNCITNCGGNPIRYTISLQRNGTTISTRTFRASSDWSNTFFYNVTASPATYRAYIKVERRKSNCVFGWKTVFTGYTNTITASTVGATPNFNVNGTAIPSSGYITTCISNIRLNAAATSCESRYYISVQESNQWWSRTYDYEWGRWFSGQAPNNINLQNLSSAYSVPPYFTGSASRQGQILIGGNLPSGQARFYRVNVCTNEPSWQCKSALIRVNSGCKLDPSTIIEDTNEYTWVENEELAQELKDAAIKASHEADINENTSALEHQTASIISLSPNPFKNSTVVQIDDYTGDAPILFELYNALGERVRSIQTQQNQFELQRDELSTGIYMYRATANDQLLGSGKVVIE